MGKTPIVTTHPSPGGPGVRLGEGTGVRAGTERTPVEAVLGYAAATRSRMWYTPNFGSRRKPDQAAAASVPSASHSRIQNPA
jgi:hypothetical protein